MTFFPSIPKCFAAASRCESVRIHGLEPGFGRGRQVNGIGRAEEYGRWKPCINIGNARKRSRRPLPKPLESPGVMVRPDLAEQSGVGDGPDRAFAQLAVKGRDHFRLAVRGAGHVIRRS